MLKLLLDADGRVLTHRDLVHAIWGHDDGGSVALLRKVVQDLRRKIEPNPKQPVHILSHSRVGYRFERSPALMVTQLDDQSSREGRPSPDALLQAAQQEARGRLKIFVGAAPGVGKTYEMLTAARARLQEGI